MKKLIILLSLFLALPAFAQASRGNNPPLAEGSIDSTDLGANSVGAAEMGVFFDSVIFCGQNAENGEIFFGPGVAAELDGGITDMSISGTACDALDNATEATADAPIGALGFSPIGMYCKTTATLGASETLSFVLRDDTADTAITCSLAEAETECASVATTVTAVAGGSAVAVEANQSSNNTDDDSWCRVYFTWRQAAD